MRCVWEKLAWKKTWTVCLIIMSFASPGPWKGNKWLLSRVHVLMHVSWLHRLHQMIVMAKLILGKHYVFNAYYILPLLLYCIFLGSQIEAFIAGTQLAWTPTTAQLGAWWKDHADWCVYIYTHIHIQYIYWALPRHSNSDHKSYHKKSTAI